MNQQEVLTALGQIGAARRGHISEQWYEHAGKDGRLHRTGPYYVWQRFLHGRKVSVRVPREEATRAQAEVERGRSVEALMCQFWENAEAQAEGKNCACRSPAATATASGSRPTSSSTSEDSPWIR